MTLLKGFSQVGDSTITNHVRENLVSFFDYGLMEKDGIVNVHIPTTGIYGGLDHRLRPVNDERYPAGKVWQASRSNWVWESGLNALVSSNPSYPGVSGVYVNSVFYPSSGTGINSHYINHYLGQVVFNTPISTGSIVECDYSYKYVNVQKVDGLSWFEQIQKNSTRSDSDGFIKSSGEYAFLAENRVQLPTIGIEAGRRKLSPFQLGGGQIVYTDFYFHCLAEDGYIRDHLVDIISLQKEVVFDGYDIDLISTASAFPVDYRGVPVSGAKVYPDLVRDYKGSQIRIKDCSFDSVYSLTPDVHVGTVKMTTECILFGV